MAAQVSYLIICDQKQLLVIRTIDPQYLRIGSWNSLVSTGKLVFRSGNTCREPSATLLWVRMGSYHCAKVRIE